MLLFIFVYISPIAYISGVYQLITGNLFCVVTGWPDCSVYSDNY